MDLENQLKGEGWAPYSKRFGLCGEKPLQIYTKENQVAIINCQHDSYAIPPFEVPIKKLIRLLFTILLRRIFKPFKGK